MSKLYYSNSGMGKPLPPVPHPPLYVSRVICLAKAPPQKYMYIDSEIKGHRFLRFINTRAKNKLILMIVIHPIFDLKSNKSSKTTCAFQDGNVLN